MPWSDAYHLLRNEPNAGRFTALIRMLFFPVVAMIGPFVIIAYAIAMFAAISGNASEWDLGDRN